MAGYLSALPALQTQVPDLSQGISYLANIPDEIRKSRMEERKMSLLEQATSMKQEEATQARFKEWLPFALHAADTPEKWETLRSKFAEHSTANPWLDDPGGFDNQIG